MDANGLELTRRNFLGAVGGLGLALVANDADAAQTAPSVRKSAKNLTEAEWTALERAVRAMKGFPKNTAVSWGFQANMHGYPPDEPAPFFQGWRTCQHGNWWFRKTAEHGNVRGRKIVGTLS